MLLKNVCSITSMQDMTDQFNVDECVEIGKEDREFLENENEDVTKQDCERNAFKRLAAKLNDILLQLYERGVKGLRELKRTIKNISLGLYLQYPILIKIWGFIEFYLSVLS